tara:strand:- start:2783 stop:3016 length:234 start_codon:yes stop_codon:yes gene_type:complete
MPIYVISHSGTGDLRRFLLALSPFDYLSSAGMRGDLRGAAGEASEGIASSFAHTFYFTMWGFEESGDFVGRVAVWDG